MVDWNNKLPELQKMMSNHMRLKAIAYHFGVSKQRIYQICTKYGIKTNKIYQREISCFCKSPEDYQVLRTLQNKRLSKKLRKTLLKELLPAPKYCPVLGIEINYGNNSRTDSTMSIDRIDNTKGYISGNVVVVSWRANRLKSDGTINEHQRLADFYSNLTKNTCKL